MALVCRPLLVGLLLLMGWMARAQTSPLDKPVSLQVSGETLQQTLILLGDAAAFSFAYSSSLIPVDSLVTYQASNKSVRDILIDLLGPAISYKTVGSHVILQAEPSAKRPDRPGFSVSGQVYNAQTGESLQDVSVYSTSKYKSDVTDASGGYSLSLSQREPQQLIRISKKGYQDTTVAVSRSEIYNLDIRLVPKPSLLEVAGAELWKLGRRNRDSVRLTEQLRIVRFFTNRKQRVNALNITDSLHRPAQLSLVPMLGTNFRLSGAVTNAFSLNLIGGYNGGVRGLEMAVGFNIIRRRMLGVQLATGFNVVGGNVSGVQLAAGFNLNLKDMKGFQAAAGANVQWGGFRGFQATSGVNVVLYRMAGLQAAAGVNYADTLVGVQLTSGLNLVRSEMRGLQVSAGFNYARLVRGVQLGIINIADSVRGLPIGVLSFVRKGYVHLDLYGDELTHINLSFRTGVSYFHNIVTAGFSWTGDAPLWRVGYGLGSEYRLGRKRRGFTSLDATVSWINRGASFINDLNLLTTINWDLGFRFKPHVALFLGPSVKIYNSRYANPETGTPGLDIAWNPQYSRVNGSQLNQVWVGLHGGFRF